MRFLTLRGFFLCMSVGLFLSVGQMGCAAPWPYQPINGRGESDASPSLSVVFVPDPQDKKFFQIIGRTQDKVLAQCSEESRCLRAHFLRALTALYESPELASHHFQKVVAAEPNSQLAYDSRLWLWLLEGGRSENGIQADFGRVGKRLVRELVAREMKELEVVSDEKPKQEFKDFQTALSDQKQKMKGMGNQLKKLSRQLDTVKIETASIQSVRQELKARDKEVKELTHQLDALRRIDQELREKAPPTRPSDEILKPQEEVSSAKSE